MSDSLVGMEGRFRVWHRHPEFGLLWEADLENGVTYQGANYLLESGFRGGSQLSNWRVGLIREPGYTAVDTSDVYSLHPGWSEYTGAGGGGFGLKRSAWIIAAAQGGRIASESVTQIPVVTSGTVRGVFLCDRVNVGDTDPSGTLYSTAVAGAAQSVIAGGTVYVTYTLRGRPVS